MVPCTAVVGLALTLERPRVSSPGRVAEPLLAGLEWSDLDLRGDRLRDGETARRALGSAPGFSLASAVLEWFLFDSAISPGARGALALRRRATRRRPRVGDSTRPSVALPRTSSAASRCEPVVDALAGRVSSSVPIGCVGGTSADPARMVRTCATSCAVSSAPATGDDVRGRADDMASGSLGSKASAQVQRRQALPSRAGAARILPVPGPFTEARRASGGERGPGQRLEPLFSRRRARSDIAQL